MLHGSAAAERPRDAPPGSAVASPACKILRRPTRAGSTAGCARSYPLAPPIDTARIDGPMKRREQRVTGKGSEQGDVQQDEDGNKGQQRAMTQNVENVGEGRTGGLYGGGVHAEVRLDPPHLPIPSSKGGHMAIARHSLVKGCVEYSLLRDIRMHEPVAERTRSGRHRPHHSENQQYEHTIAGHWQSYYS